MKRNPWLAATAVSSLAFTIWAGTAHAQLTGPVYPPPGGVTRTDSGTDEVGQEVRDALGRTITYSAITGDHYKLYWAVRADASNFFQNGAGFNTAYALYSANAPAGLVTYSSTFRQYYYSGGVSYTYSDLTAYLEVRVTDASDNPLPLVSNGVQSRGYYWLVVDDGLGTSYSSFKVNYRVRYGLSSPMETALGMNEPGYAYDRGTLNPQGYYSSPAGAAGVASGMYRQSNINDGFWYEPLADVSVTKTDSSSYIDPGAPITYTIEVTNDGPNGISGLAVADTMPAQLENVSWTCSGTNGGTCPAGPVSGNISTAAVNLPYSGSASMVTFTVLGDVRTSPVGNLSNTVSITMPTQSADPDGGSDAEHSATDATSINCSQTVALTDGLWKLMALPCVPDVSVTPISLFGDDLGPDDYGNTWIMARRAPTSFVYLDASETVEHGQPYLIVDMSGTNPTIDMGEAPDPPAINSSAVGGYFKQPVTGSSTNATLVAYPYNVSSAWGDVLVCVGGGVCPGGTYNLATVPITVMQPHMWNSYNGTEYTANDGSISEGTLSSFEAVWTKIYQDVELWFPAPASAKGAEAANNTDLSKLAPGEWMVQLIAESTVDKVTVSNHLGQLHDSANGVDRHDVFELPPLDEDYLMLTFPMVDEQGVMRDFTRNIKGAGDANRRLQWQFEVRSPLTSRGVTLRWVGPEWVIKRSRITDLQTGREFPAIDLRYYRFNVAAGQAYRFSWVLSGKS